MWEKGPKTLYPGEYGIAQTVASSSKGNGSHLGQGRLCSASLFPNWTFSSTIEKFKVDFWTWQEWSEKYHEVRGTEYDAQDANIRIKGRSPLHEAATGAIGEWFLTVRDLLNTVIGRQFDNAGSAGKHNQTYIPSLPFLFPFLSCSIQFCFSVPYLVFIAFK